MALDVPVYHLDGVVQNRSERESFDGPLDLILLLLSKNKMEIADIQIALILDQYLAWMNQRQTLDLEVASEFVAMAAHLVYIKTRMLLSLQDEEVTSEVEALIASLEARQRSASYSKIQAVLPTLQHRYAVGKDYLPKPPEPLLPAAEYTYQHLPTDLPQALNKLLLKRSADDGKGQPENEQHNTEKNWDAEIFMSEDPVDFLRANLLFGFLMPGDAVGADFFDVGIAHVGQSRFPVGAQLELHLFDDGVLLVFGNAQRLGHRAVPLHQLGGGEAGGIIVGPGLVFNEMGDGVNRFMYRPDAEIELHRRAFFGDDFHRSI